MTEQQPEKGQQPEISEQYGQQGNQGQYGQGQYDSEGRPDPLGKQGQQIKPDPRLAQQGKKVDQVENPSQPAQGLSQNDAKKERL